MSRLSRRVVALATVGLVVVGAGVAGFRFFDKPEKALASDGPAPAQTVEITRTDLSQAKELAGDGGSKTIKGRLAGTVTWLPKARATVARGDVLYRVNDKPVVLFYGSTPLFRPIEKTVNGPDVRVSRRI